MRSEFYIIQCWSYLHQQDEAWTLQQSRRSIHVVCCPWIACNLCKSEKYNSILSGDLKSLQHGLGPQSPSIEHNMNTKLQPDWFFAAANAHWSARNYLWSCLGCPRATNRKLDSWLGEFAGPAYLAQTTVAIVANYGLMSGDDYFVCRKWSRLPQSPFLWFTRSAESCTYVWTSAPRRELLHWKAAAPVKKLARCLELKVTRSQSRMRLGELKNLKKEWST